MKISKPRFEENSEIRQEMGCDGMWKTEITVPVRVTIGVFGNKNDLTEKWLAKAIDQGVGYIDINDEQGEDPFELIKVMTHGADHTTTPKYRQKANTELIRRLKEPIQAMDRLA